MSDVCKEFKGWFKSFTKTETLLCALQTVLLAGFIVFLTFLILHLVACLKSKQIENTVTEPVFTTSHITNDATTVLEEDTNITDEGVFTLKPNVTCTWKPSEKTKATTHYYEKDRDLRMTNAKFVTTTINSLNIQIIKHNSEDIQKEYIEGTIEEENGTRYQQGFLLALVKRKPPHDFTFGCTLTIISHYWTITAASCIEAIEEVDSLDSFIMIDGLGEKNGSVHPVSDVMIHPQYLGVNNTYDLAALKSDDIIAKGGLTIVTLPTMLNYYLVTIGERFSILGYGTFRNIDKNPLSRSIREVHVFSLPLSQCPRGTGAWSPRHLVRGTPVEHEACGTAPLCAGVLHSRTSPCNYCAGTPLLRQNLLLGVMSDNQHCGLSCEPALYVNLALVRDWLDFVISSF